MNNRNVMIAGIFLLTVGSLLLLLALFRSSPPRRTLGEVVFLPTPDIKIAVRETPFPENQLPPKNPFDPLRGEAPPEEAKPETAATALTLKPPPRRNDLKLTGIFGYENEKGVLITAGRIPGPPGKAQKTRFKVGDMVADDFILTEISAKSVTLKRGSETLTLSLLPTKQEKAQ